MLRFRLVSWTAPLVLLGASLGVAQYGGGDHSNFNRGLNQGAHGGQYHHPDNGYGRNYGNDGYRGGDPGYQGGGGNYGHNGYGDRQGGIGPGKGALIGGAGGAALGAVFGGGLKGSLIGGAAGAGIGAIAGQAHQNNRNNGYYGR